MKGEDERDESGMMPDLEHLFSSQEEATEEIEEDIKKHVDPLAKEEATVEKYMREERGD